MTHPENQDRIVTRVASREFPFKLIAVADGISSLPFGGSVARWVTEFHLAKDFVTVGAGDNVGGRFFDYLNSLHELFCDEFTDLPEMYESGACLSVAVQCDGETHCYWVGDSPIYETTVGSGGYSTKLVSEPDALGSNGITDWFGGTSPFDLKTVRFSSNAAIVTITSDGAIHDAEMLSRAYSEHGFSEGLADEVCQEALKNPRSDDVSIVAMELGR